MRAIAVIRTTTVGTALVAALLAAAAGTAGAQQAQAELHAIYQRANESHQSSYGGGGEYGLGFGSGPVQLSTDVGLDYQAQEGGGQQQLGASLDAALQFGASEALLSPYLGGGVSANWLSGSGQAFGDGPQLGLEYIVGLGVQLSRRAGTRLNLELRPGYVRTQEHYLSGLAGISTSF